MSFRPTTYRAFDETFTDGVKILLVANVLVFVIQQLAPPWFTFLFGLRPVDVVTELRIWQPFTYMFLHGGFFHVFFNLLVLWMMGTEVERFWGRREFLTYYVICGLGAAALAFVFAWDSLVIGASGAVFGVMVAFALMFPQRTIYLWFVIPVPARYLVLILFVVELLLIRGGDGVARFAHVGGAVTGYLYMRLGWRNALDLGGAVRRWRRPRLTLHHGGGGRGSASAPGRDVRDSEIDRILDKISVSGLDSLTPEESRLLEEASRRGRSGT